VNDYVDVRDHDRDGDVRYHDRGGDVRDHDRGGSARDHDDHGDDGRVDRDHGDALQPHLYWLALNI